MKVVFIVPSYNSQKNVYTLVDSVLTQTDDNWEMILIDDMSTDDTHDAMIKMSKIDDRVSVVLNKEKKYALRNIVESSRAFQDDDKVVIGVIDGDDSLCNPDTVKLVLDEYSKGSEVVWTAHKWDINGMNISRELDKNINPYNHPWVSSHFRTFKSTLLSSVPDDNFKNYKGSWFKRGYDQALMLPLLHVSCKNTYVDDVCYLYNIDSVSMPKRDWTEMDQISTINFVRARGFISENTV
jgi:glycosyltransferase involved in cell wall biosynthesis